MQGKKIGALLIMLVWHSLTQAQDFSAYKKAFFIRGTDTLAYRILYPENYQSGKSYPLVMFLHGAGMRGRDNERPLQEGGDLFLQDSIRKKYPAIVIYPQCPSDSMWFHIPPGPAYDTTVAFNHKMNKLAVSVPEALVKLLMDSLAKHRIADAKRIYVMGNSLGAFGAYDLIVHYPPYFAAAIIMCGQANAELYPKEAAHLPVWIFHGDADNIINIWPDRAVYKALQQRGAKHAKYTEYPGLGHAIPPKVFAEPGLISWLFSFSK